MATLLADVGGTNARLALSDGETIDKGSVTRFRGEDHAGFDEVVAAYLDIRGRPRIEAACVAVAGPVSGGRAELTNRNWDFSEERLAQATGAARVRLINDLTALGFATATLSGDGLDRLRAADPDRSRNGQALVVNAGTGFNVCAARALGGGALTCLEHEEGHTTLPANISDRLRAELGPKADAFLSVEELFAGRGLANLHAALNGVSAIRSEKVAEAFAAGDAGADRSYRLYAELFGLLCRELSLRFMPLEGMYLAGSVARSVALPALEPIFTGAMLAEPYMRHIPENVPVLVIRDDMAALSGCLAALR